MKALVLAGGEIKGAWEAGALHWIATQKGYRPDLITGTSVGALNTLFLCDWMGRHPTAPFFQATNALVQFWTDEVTGADVLASKRSWWFMLRHWKNWQGMQDMEPLRRLLNRIIDPVSVFISPIPGFVAMTDLAAARVEYAPVSIETAFASAMIPIVMPHGIVEGRALYDGGVVDIAPLSFAIKRGATEALALVPSPTNPAPHPTTSLPGLIGRLLTTFTNTIVNDDLKKCAEVNAGLEVIREELGAVRLPDEWAMHRHIDLTIVRPRKALPFDIFHFTPEDIVRMIDTGMQDAADVWEARDA